MLEVLALAEVVVEAEVDNHTHTDVEEAEDRTDTAEVVAEEDRSW